jgi:AcrR family transcriptional regulator
MPQVKKPEVRTAILRAAQRLFAQRGYANTTLQAIARAARVSTANVYVYFASKLDILYAIYAPWMQARLARLAAELESVDDPRERLARVLRTLWRDIPAEQGGFANNIMQAISSMSPEDGYRPTLLRHMEAELERLLAAALPPARRRGMPLDRLAHLVVMAFDGFIIFRHVDPARPCDDATIELMCTLLLGRESNAAARRRALRSAPPKSARHPPKGRSVSVRGGIR